MAQQRRDIAARPQGARSPLRIAIPLVLASLSACASFEGDSAASDAAITDPDLTGSVELAYVEHSEGAAELEYSVALDDAQRVQLVFGADPELAPGTELEVWGEWADDSRLIVRSFQVASIPKRIDAPLSRNPKHHRVAVLATDNVSITESGVRREMEEVGRFYAETTRGIDTFSMEVYRHYDLGLSTTDCDNTGGVMSRLTEAFTQDGFDPANYEHLVFIVPKACGSWGGASAFVGAVDDNGAHSVRRMSIYKDGVANAYAFIHELGHNLGMRHAQSATCAGGFYAPSLAGCSIIEYGDSNDPMGGGWTEVYWNTPHQRFFGWIAPERVVTAGGSGTFNLIPMDAKQGCGIQALRIPIPNEPARYFYVEYRKARSDSAYAGTGTSVRGDAVLITRSQDGLTTNSSTQRIELGTKNYEGALVGSHYDLGGGVSVQVRAMGAESAQVVVQTPGTNPARDDKGSSVATLSDGSVGLASCSTLPPSDACPSDPNKTEPGLCGCGVPEGTCSVNNCPNDPNKTEPGQCGCGVADTDSDRDGAANCRDGCPADAAKLAPGACGCGVAEGTCGPTTVSLRVEDTFIDSARRTQNFRAATSIRVDNSPSVQRSLFKPIGLSNVPRGARVESATLVIQVVNGGNTMSARKLTTAWSQGTVTFNTAPNAASAFASVNGGTGTKLIDVTQLVQAWVNGEAIHGIGLYPTGPDGVVIPSAEHSVAQNRPTLRITYRRAN